MIEEEGGGSQTKGEVEINVRVALPESESVFDIKFCHKGVHSTEIALTQKSCIFTQTKCKKCIIKILMRPRMQDVDLKNSLHLL